MDALDARFICLRCEYGKRKAAKQGEHIAVYTWRSAISHALTCRYNSDGNTWKRLSDRVTAKVKTLTDSNGLDDDESREASKCQWGCKTCRDYDVEPPPCTISRLQQHSLFNHGYVSPYLKHNFYGSSRSERHYRLARFPPGMFETVVPRSQLDM
ncbi:hypothetical protein BD410DRAFT_790473 [Rickenella mellea]|uniref:Uncharacterized protein n=1 Tax=Rickenella mellea TaxID=50990 RepID=A0A4Y7PZH9_9AGAM|nr:hypothetical protein BD410DRAFT_790473 [Rickenella mellea]